MTAKKTTAKEKTAKVEDSAAEEAAVQEAAAREAEKIDLPGSRISHEREKELAELGYSKAAIDKVRY